MSEKWIFRFEELGKEHNDLVGKKCANLGEMATMGMPVPHGFALSLEAYKRFFEQTKASKEILKYLSKQSPKNIKEWENASKAIMEIVEAKEMPKEMAETITSYYEELCEKTNIPDVAVSARSAGAVSRPGQYSTFLNVRGKSNLLDKIIKVWGSSFNTRSLMHREKSGLPLESDPIGVAVLKMVNARCAGVTFTAIPQTGDTAKLMFEANWGLGESVVSGKTTPDSYVLDKHSLEVLEKKLGKKSMRVVYCEAGVREEATPENLACSFCMQEEELKEIGKMAKSLEKHFGVPQDTEWAIDEDFQFPDNIFMLQTRPIKKMGKKKDPTEQIADLMIRYLT